MTNRKRKPIINSMECSACDLRVTWDAHRESEPAGWESFPGCGMHCPECSNEMRIFYREANKHSGRNGVADD